MAIVGKWTDAKLFAGSYDFSGDSNEIHGAYAVAMLDATTFGQSTKVNRAGLVSKSVNAKGFVQFGANLQDAQNFANIGLSTIPVSVFPTNIPIVGDRGFFFQAAQANYNQNGAHGEMLGFDFSAMGADGFPAAPGFVLEPGITAKTATGNGTETNNPGSVASGKFLYAALHVVAFTGASLDVIVQSAPVSGFASPTNRITFTQATGITSQFATRVAGPITDSFWRVTWTIAGASPSIRFAVIMAIA